MAASHQKLVTHAISSASTGSLVEPPPLPFPPPPDTYLDLPAPAPRLPRETRDGDMAACRHPPGMDGNWDLDASSEEGDASPGWHAWETPRETRHDMRHETAFGDTAGLARQSLEWGKFRSMAELPEETLPFTHHPASHHHQQYLNDSSVFNTVKMLGDTDRQLHEGSGKYSQGSPQQHEGYQTRALLGNEVGLTLSLLSARAEDAIALGLIFTTLHGEKIKIEQKRAPGKRSKASPYLLSTPTIPPPPLPSPLRSSPTPTSSSSPPLLSPPHPPQSSFDVLSVFLSPLKVKLDVLLVGMDLAPSSVLSPWRLGHALPPTADRMAHWESYLDLPHEEIICTSCNKTKLKFRSLLNACTCTSMQYRVASRSIMQGLDISLPPPPEPAASFLLPIIEIEESSFLWDVRGVTGKASRVRGS